MDTTYHNHWSQSASFRYGESLFRYSEDEDLASSRPSVGSEFRVLVEFSGFWQISTAFALVSGRG